MIPTYSNFYTNDTKPLVLWLAIKLSFWDKNTPYYRCIRIQGLSSIIMNWMNLFKMKPFLTVHTFWKLIWWARFYLHWVIIKLFWLQPNMGKYFEWQPLVEKYSILSIFVAYLEQSAWYLATVNIQFLRSII